MPVVVSSAGVPSYALGYPAALSAQTETLVADKKQAQTLSRGLPTRSADFKASADPKLLLYIVQQSDQAGRGEAFAAAHADASASRQFWDEERGPITSRVSGAAQKQVTEAGCTKAEVGGAISYALKDGVDKQLEKRLRARNEAQRTIERNKNALGQANVAAAQKLADDVAMTSFLVNSELVFERDRLRVLLDEQGDVDSTLRRAAEDEVEWQKAKPATGADLKTSQELVSALQKSRSALPAAANGAENALVNIDLDIENARKEYQAGLDLIEEALEKQAEGAKR